MDKESFRTFMKAHPELLTNIDNNSMSFQKYYEIYNIYGEDMNVWNKYIPQQTVTPAKTVASTAAKSDLSISDVVGMIKNIDLDTLQKGVTGMQKAISLVQELTSSKKAPSPYEPRPLYKYFED